MIANVGNLLLGQKYNKQRKKQTPDQAENKNILSFHLDYGMQNQIKKNRNSKS